MESRNSVVLDAAAFPLPTVAPRLLAMRAELLQGRGFQLVKGLPLHQWSREKAAAAFLGIGAHIGAARSQNSAGHLLGHVRDLGLASDDPSVRIYQTAERQTFHADSCDVVALACLCQAKSGGESLLCSALTVYNEILETRPDLAAELLRPVAIGMSPLDVSVTQKKLPHHIIELEGKKPVLIIIAKTCHGRNWD